MVRYQSRTGKFHDDKEWLMAWDVATYQWWQILLNGETPYGYNKVVYQRYLDANGHLMDISPLHQLADLHGPFGVASGL